MTVKTEKSLGYCLGCDYSLQGLTSARCPECGREFDPADPRTRNTEGPIGDWGRFFMRPIGWGMPVLALLYLLMCCWETRVPMGPVKFPFASRYLGPLLWVLWMARVTARLAFRMRYQETTLVKPGGWRLAWVVPFLIIVAMSLVGWNVPVQVGFSISQPGLEHLVHEAEAAKATAVPEHWVGVYKCQKVDALPAGYRGIQITVAPPENATPVVCGFAYSVDDNLPHRIGWEVYEKLAPRWYSWHTER